MKYAKLFFTLAILLHCKISLAQTDIEKAGNIIIQLYKLNIYDHGCSTLKPKLARGKADKILAQSDDYDYPLKASEIYEWKKKDRSYWEKVFDAIYVEDIAHEYVKHCDNQPKSNRESYLNDFRFPKAAGEIASFQIRKVNFEKISGSAKKIHGVAKIKLNKGEGFSLHYVLHKTPAGWRVFDIFEMERSADRDNEFFVSNSLQEGLAELKKSR